MRAPRDLVALFVVALPAVAFAPLVAAQDEDRGAPKHAEKAHDPNNLTSLSSYMELCVAGSAKYEAHDMPAAIDAYKRAILLAPKNPYGHYLMGEAQLGTGNVKEAETEWKLALDLTDEKTANVRGKVLFVLADLKERQRKWDEAKAAWQAYAEFAAKHADAGVYPQTASSRQQSIDDMLRQDKLYEVVRQRIAAEAAEKKGK
jgi:hypothetical protein